MNIQRPNFTMATATALLLFAFSFGGAALAAPSGHENAKPATQHTQRIEKAPAKSIKTQKKASKVAKAPVQHAVKKAKAVGKVEPKAKAYPKAGSAHPSKGHKS